MWDERNLRGWLPAIFVPEPLPASAIVEIWQVQLSLLQRWARQYTAETLRAPLGPLERRALRRQLVPWLYRDAPWLDVADRLLSLRTFRREPICWPER